MSFAKLVWMTINNATIDHMAFCGDILMSGAAVDLPQPPKSSDVFKRAVKATSKDVAEFGYWEANGTDKTFVYKALFDPDLKLPLLGLAFNKDTDVLTPTYHDPFIGTHARIAEAIQQIETQIAAESNQLTAYALREYVRATLEKTFHGIRMDDTVSGTLVFDEFADDLVKFAEVINGIDGCTITMLDLELTGITRDGLRDPIIQALKVRLHGVEQMVDLMQEKSKVSKKLYENLLASLDAVIALAAEVDEVMEFGVFDALQKDFAAVGDKLHKLLGVMKV